MKLYTHSRLMEMTEAELIEVKNEQISELADIQNRKLVIVGNIMSIQGLMKKELSNGNVRNVEQE